MKFFDAKLRCIIHRRNTLKAVKIHSSKEHKLTVIKYWHKVIK